MSPPAGGSAVPRMLAALLALAALGLAPLPPAEARDAPPEVRGLWVDAFGEGLNTPGQIDDLVGTAEAANLNTIFAQVVRRGDCWCNSASVPRTQASIAPLPFDPLQTLIDRAHAAGIDVHAWVTVTAIWNRELAASPEADDHVFNTHGPDASGADDWTMRRSDGALLAGNDWHLDPGHPAAASHVVRTVTSLVDNYDIDGVNLDRIRYPDHNLSAGEPAWGYNPVALSRFRRATGRTDRPAPTDREWTQWRRDQVTQLVRRIYLDVFARDPGVVVSADTITYGFGPSAQGGWTATRTYADVLQDWRGWMAEGILDLNVAMNYKRHDEVDEPNDQRRMYAEWNDYVKDHQYDRHAVVGSALYLNTIAGSVRQVRLAVGDSAAGNPSRGWVGYSYHTPDRAAADGDRSRAASRDELVGALTAPGPLDPVTPPVFAEPAAVPSMSWKTDPERGHVRVRARTLAGRGVDQAAVRLYQGGRRVLTRPTDGTGWFGAVDLDPGVHRVTVAFGESGGDRTANIVVDAGQRTAVTVTPSPACPPDAVPASGFGDAAGSVHRRAIDCLAWYGITEGVTEDRFDPGGRVTRGQMATFLARLLRAVDPGLLPTPTDQGFTDIAGNVHRESINQLAELGVTVGRTPTRFDPAGSVTRGQTASLLAAVHEVVTGRRPTAAHDYFPDDDGSTHEANVDAAAALQVYLGDARGRAAVNDTATRAQMASLVTRYADVLLEDGRLRPPAS